MAHTHVCRVGRLMQHLVVWMSACRWIKNPGSTVLMNGARQVMVSSLALVGRRVHLHTTR